VPPAQPRKPCLGILFCAVPGILLSEAFPCSLPVAAFAVLCFALATFLSRRLLPFALLVLTTFFIRHDLDWRRSPGRLPIDLLTQGVSLLHATGVVTSDPLPAGYAFHTVHSRFELNVTGISSGGQSFETSFPAQAYWTGPPPAWGDQVTLTAAISPVPPPRNPGEFNAPAYLARKGIFAQLSCAYASDNRILAHNQGNPFLTWARNARAALQRRITLGIDDDPEKSGLVQTITLGLKQETSPAVRELFQHVGALHLFVVNGLHVALLAAILAFLLKPLGIRRRIFAAVIIPILFAYALLTGLSPGSVRAAIMAAVMFGSSFFERRPFSFNTLAAAALILLLCDTNELYHEGFQFSFGVVAAIIFLADYIRKPILPLGLPDPFLPRLLWTPCQRLRAITWRKVSDLAAICVASSVGSFPFSAGYFNLVTPSGFLANLLLVPIAGCILAEAIFSLLASWMNSLALLFNNTNWLFASVMLAVVHGFALLPGGHFFVSTNSAPRPECRLTILDLEPGQAIVIETQTSVWLVDCGNSPSYSRIVRPFLESQGVNRLDGLILTHGAAPSIGAAQNVIDDFAPRDIFESTLIDRSSTRRALEAALEKAGRPKTLLDSGDKLQLSPQVTCSILFPPAGFEGRTAADKSLILRIEDGPARVLLMSDSAFTGEHWLLDNTHDLRASVIVIDGQSPDLAGTDAFIGAVHPVAAIRGEPAFMAPTGQDRHWAAGLFSQNVTPFLQSATGAVTIDLTQSRVTLSGFVNSQQLAKNLSTQEHFPK
jgi:ComEC/Rec2-related protein